MIADSDNRRRGLRTAIEERRALLAPGAANALTARIIEDLGFEVAYVTGAGLANTELGMPDLGVLTMSELADATARIADACALPLVVDMDTGFGNALNVGRSVRVLERMGASAVQIEDQVFPKRCGHFDGKEVIPLDEMLGKLKAALDSRGDESLLVIARTDARGSQGLEPALERARAMLETGADLSFVEAPADRHELSRIAGLPGPQVANMVIGGRTPLLTQSDLAALGMSLVLYANAALQASIAAIQSVLGELRRHGTLAHAQDLMASFEERQRIVDKPGFDRLEQRYRPR